MVRFEDFLDVVGDRDDDSSYILVDQECYLGHQKRFRTRALLLEGGVEDPGDCWGLGWQGNGGGCGGGCKCVYGGGVNGRSWRLQENGDDSGV